MAAIGSGLGSAGFVVLDDHDDLVAAVAGVSRFLAVESCGQCTPCKEDGLVLAERLATLAASRATDADLKAIADRVRTVATGARCNLGRQQEAIVGGLLRDWADHIAAHAAGAVPGVEPDRSSPRRSPSTTATSSSTSATPTSSPTGRTARNGPAAPRPTSTPSTAPPPAA